MGDDNRREMPQSDLDFNLMTTNSVWGKEEISPELRDKLSELLKDSDGEIDKKSLWGLLGFYTRDMRLGNLKKGEVEFCQHYLDLANDLLQCNQIRPFMISLSRVATRLELSQSSGGFLRKQMSTITHQQQYSGLTEPMKRSLFGIGKKGSGGGNV